MKKVLSVISMMMLGVIVGAGSANAATEKEVLSCNATEANGKISVSGTVEEGVLAVAISVYNADESKLLTVETDAVRDNAYAYDVEMASGDYVVKVADYDGGKFCRTTVTTKTAVTPTPTATAETNEKAEVSSPDSGRVTNENSVAAVAAPAVVGVVMAGIGGVVWAKKRRK